MNASESFVSYKNVSTTTDSVTASTSTTKISYDTTTICTVYNNVACDPMIIAIEKFATYGPNLAFAFGIPGNFLTCIILARMRPFNSSIIWIIALSFTDLFNLAMRIIVSRAVVGNGIVDVWDTWTCRFFMMASQTCDYCSYVYVVGLTVERFIAVQFPLKMQQWCTLRRSVLGVIICLVICLGQSMYCIEVYRASPSNSLCVMRAKYLPTWGLYYEFYFQNTVMVLLPLVLLILLNALIARRLLLARKLQKTMSESQNKEKSKQQKQINRMLMASSILLFMCLMPNVLYSYISDSLPRTDEVVRDRRVAIMFFSVLRMYNTASNFILYIIAANKFRSEFLRLVTCNRYSGSKLTSRNTTTTTKFVSTVT